MIHRRLWYLSGFFPIIDNGTTFNNMKLLKRYLIPLILSVTPLMATPKPEYPRPQFERESWINLNGEWTYNIDHTNVGGEREYFKSTGFNDKITVPFCPESKLSGVGHTDFIENLWYHKKISIPQDWAEKRILLNFGAIYYKSEIYIDGKFIARHFGGSSSFSVDLTDYVKPGSEHNLVVYAHSDIRSLKQTAGKQCLRDKSYGCNYTRTTGIWQTVWMEAVAKAGLHSVQVVTDIDQEKVLIRPRFHGVDGGNIKVTVKDGDKEVATVTTLASDSSVITLSLPNSKKWSPESPFLYDVNYQVTNKKGEIVDEVNSYFGMRKVHIEGNKIYLNNKPYYQRLVLDQGFYPDGIWTSPNDEALKNDILLSKKCGFNGARLHQKVFEERFYYWADKLGYITWGEAPSWGMDCNDIEVARNFIAEWAEIVERDRNHPSLIIWTPTNEQFWPDAVQYPRLIEDLYRITKSMDSTRPFHGTSGGVHIATATDIWSAHTYQQDPVKLKESLYKIEEKEGKKVAKFFEQGFKVITPARKNIGFNEPGHVDHHNFVSYKGEMPYLLDEFGGIKWSKAAQDAKQQVAWGYGQAPTTIEEFYTRLEGQVNSVLSLSDHIWGYCYTQLTDVEQEQNGLFNYDRTPKFDMDRIHAIFSKNPEEAKED